jgi:hypothetical protein
MGSYAGDFDFDETDATRFTDGHTFAFKTERAERLIDFLHARFSMKPSFSTERTLVPRKVLMTFGRNLTCDAAFGVIIRHFRTSPDPPVCGRNPARG